MKISMEIKNGMFYFHYEMDKFKEGEELIHTTGESPCDSSDVIFFGEVLNKLLYQQSGSIKNFKIEQLIRKVIDEQSKKKKP